MTPADLHHELYTLRDLSPSEAAGVLGVARSTLHRWLRDGMAIPDHRETDIWKRLADRDAAITGDGPGEEG